MKVIDFHSHILPGIDDGSKNVETSIEMLRRSKAAGVDIMIATPHFYADCDRIERFTEKRLGAYQKIEDQLGKDTPQILLGAEVAFFEGMDQAEKIDRLTINGSRIMLLEMPFRMWRQKDIDQVRNLIEERKFSLIIAHLERFMKTAGNKEYIEELMSLPVTIQINAESLSDWKQSHTLIQTNCQRRRRSQHSSSTSCIRSSLMQDIQKLYLSASIKRVLLPMIMQSWQRMNSLRSIRSMQEKERSGSLMVLDTAVSMDIRLCRQQRWQKKEKQWMRSLLICQTFFRNDGSTSVFMD